MCLSTNTEQELRPFTNNLEINHILIKPMKERDTYKYLVINENISYVGPINKKSITKVHYHRPKYGTISIQ